jgi:hypothetical protein
MTFSELNYSPVMSISSSEDEYEGVFAAHLAASPDKKKTRREDAKEQPGSSSEQEEPAAAASRPGE